MRKRAIPAGEEFPARVQILRDKAGSIPALADATVVSYSAIRHYLKGGEPTLGALVRLADGMKCSLEWLARGAPTNGNVQGVKGAVKKPPLRTGVKDAESVKVSRP
jgi:hypothetical protein